MSDVKRGLDIEIKENGDKIVRITITIPSSMYYKILSINRELGLYSKTDAENIKNFLSAALPMMIKEFIKK